MNILLRQIYVWLLLALAWLGAAADGTGLLKNYDIWRALPSDLLIEMGRGFYEGNNPDSALVCYTIVANRYNSTSKSDKAEQKWVGSALNQLGIIHTFFYVDYNKANRYLLLAKKIAEQNDNNFSLDRLAELIDANSRYYVSQVLNDYYHQSFPKVVNEYRIREACRRINDHEHYSQFTVQAIAESVGFGSYPNFVTNFKKFTGLTPSAYRKQGRKPTSASTPDPSPE